MREPVLFIMCVLFVGAIATAFTIDQHLEEQGNPMVVIDGGDSAEDETPAVYRIVITGIRGQVKFDVVSYTFDKQNKVLTMVLPNGDTISASTKGAYWTHRMLKPDEVS